MLCKVFICVIFYQQFYVLDPLTTPPNKTFQIPVSKLGAFLKLQQPAQTQEESFASVAEPASQNISRHQDMEMEVHRGVQTSQPQNNLHYHHHHMQHYETYIKTEPSEGSSSAYENSGSLNKIHGK